MSFNPNPTPIPRKTCDSPSSSLGRDNLLKIQVTLGNIKDMVENLQKQIDEMKNGCEDYGDCNDV